jgi:hypothetical protein
MESTKGHFRDEESRCLKVLLSLGSVVGRKAGSVGLDTGQALHKFMRKYIWNSK